MHKMAPESISIHSASSRKFLYDQTAFTDWLGQEPRQPLRWNRIDLQSLVDNT